MCIRDRSKDSFRDGIKEGIADVMRCKSENVVVAGMETCPDGDERCTRIGLQVDMEHIDAAEAGISNLKLQATTPESGTSTAMEAVQGKWRAKGEFAPGELYLNSTSLQSTHIDQA
eukprot:TRINITY_DN3371_c0_g1_i4.p1 TRINITY_DN3371_c0_g1~~TRINITY_DN3371_c0_g1_i4.p1  ORF type:complete len:116 (+),score=24.24 TRINITY_DN3371_c0_g1_i4:180-527(+)